MGTANETQVGGDHYKTDYQHWDMVCDVFGPEYLMGCASKYIIRWRRKNGLEDLKKSLHYIQKAIERNVPTRSPFSWAERQRHITSLVQQYPELTLTEVKAVRIILLKDEPKEWKEAHHLLSTFLVSQVTP